MTLKIVTVIGARPQFVKAAAVSRVLLNMPNIDEVLVHTGQHYDRNMSQVFFEQMEIPEPLYNLAIGSGSHGAQTGEMIGAIEDVLVKEKPDWVLVYGDTNSTLAGSIAASKMRIQIAHVEAGLRSYNRMMPEEINRVLSDHVSSLLFAPTEGAVSNLEKEGISGDLVKNVGDVMYDASLYYAKRAENLSSILDELQITRGEYVLATVHRAENTDNQDRLSAIVKGIARVAKQIRVVWPVHPRLRRLAHEMGLDINSISGVDAIDPVGYMDMIMLEKNARLIATDSGGVQKEAFFYKVPCVTLRDETEWVETVCLNWNRIISPVCEQAVSQGILYALDVKGLEGRPYGDGDAVDKIAYALAGFA